MVDVQTPHIPDAIMRIKQRQAEAKQEALEKKRKLAEKIEIQRANVLESYNIRPMN